MKSLNEYIVAERAEQNEVVVLNPDELETLLKIIKNKSDKGVCLRYDGNETFYCFYDERNGLGPSSWPWKKL